MSQQESQIISAFKAHVDALYPNQTTDSAPVGLDQYRHPHVPTAPKQPPTDPITAAVDAAQPGQPTKPEPLTTASSKDVPAANDATSATAGQAQAEAAKEKLAQEALLANPAEMRKLFPIVYDQVSVNHNNHLDEYEIKKGLENPNLPHDEKNFLTVLQAGYDHLREDPFIVVHDFIAKGTLSNDPDGVSAGSLAVIDKAVNRNIADDPYFSSRTSLKMTVSLGVAGALVGLYQEKGGDVKGKLLFSGLGALAGVTAVYGKALFEKFDGDEDRKYDQVKSDYQSFVQDYQKGPVKAK